MGDTGYFEMLGRLALALVLGGLLGAQREALRKPAGLKTHMMVSLGAASFTLVTLHLFARLDGSGPSFRSDPLRIVEGVIGGIGFLGAGTIIQARGSVRGITTAATIWVVGAVGVACGGGEFELAGTVAGLAFLILTVIGNIERRFHPRNGLEDPDS